MKRNLQSTIGIVTRGIVTPGIATLVLVAIFSVNEVNAQSTFSPNSQWYSSSQTFNGEVATIPQQYPSAIHTNPVYSPQGYNWFPAQPQTQLQPQTPWASQYAPIAGQSVAQPQTFQSNIQPQTFQSNIYSQSPPASSPAAFPNTANVMQCQGGT